MTTTKPTGTGRNIDVQPSPHHVRIEIDGEVIADTTRALAIEETRCPTRYYDIRGYLSFYPSRVDAFLIDGKPLAHG